MLLADAADAAHGQDALGHPTAQHSNNNEHMQKRGKAHAKAKDALATLLEG